MAETSSRRDGAGWAIVACARQDWQGQHCAVQIANGDGTDKGARTFVVGKRQLEHRRGATQVDLRLYRATRVWIAVGAWAAFAGVRSAP
jgi:hypothetical protein